MVLKLSRKIIVINFHVPNYVIFYLVTRRSGRLSSGDASLWAQHSVFNHEKTVFRAGIKGFRPRPASFICLQCKILVNAHIYKD